MYKISKNLNDLNWKLYFAKNENIKSFADCIHSINELEENHFDSVIAHVPGNFINDLYLSNIIDDPLYGNNAWKTQELEGMHVWYTASFDYKFKENEKILFEGLDTISDIYLDGKHMIHTDNMFLPFEINGNSFAHHELLIHFTPAVIEARKYQVPAQSNALWYNYQSLFLRKSAFMFGWDIMPRIVNCGIWKNVSIIETPNDSINDVYVYTIFTNPIEKKAKIRIIFNISVSGDIIQKYKLRFSGKCKNSSFCEEITPWGTQYGRMAFVIENANIWWPRGYGNPDLYDCKAELIKDGNVLDTYDLKIGLRTVELINTEGNVDGKGKFLFKINGKEIFCKGVNWSPLTPFVSDGINKLDKGLNDLLSTNSNIVRIWGGGFYEDKKFYEFCDKNGIMIWQDFMMACAVYPNKSEFLDRLEKEIDYQIIRLRNHPSIILWSGDNECDCTYNSWAGIIRDPNENLVTRQLIPVVVHRNDLTRPYLPSSPYISSLCYNNNLKTTEEHLWGDRPPYESDYYSQSKCNFVSEIGFFGAISENSALNFIPKEYLYPITDNNGDVNIYWLAHSSETMLAEESPYKYRLKKVIGFVNNYFGYLPDSYKEFCKLSQIIQAEAVKIFIEIFRSDKQNRSGFIYWNLKDGYGIVSEALIDYYDDKKLSYYFLKKAYEPLSLMLIKNNGKHNLVISNDSFEDIQLDISVMCDNKEIYSTKITSKSNSSEIIKEFDNLISDKIYILKYKQDKSTFVSHYIDDIHNINTDYYLNTLIDNKIIDNNIFEK